MLLGNAAAPPVSPHYGSRAPRALSGSRSGSLLKLLGCFKQLPLQGLHMFICSPLLLLTRPHYFCVLASAAAPTV